MSDAAERAARMAEERLAKVELADARPPEFSDEALAQRFAHRHGDGLRFVAAWSHWYAWIGARWGLDSTLDAFDRARAVCRVRTSPVDTGESGGGPSGRDPERNNMKTEWLV